jgi:hypothetical protein
MDHILAKSLEKDAALRYQSAAEFRADLKRLRRDVDSGRCHGHVLVAGGAKLGAAVRRVFRFPGDRRAA